MFKCCYWSKNANGVKLLHPASTLPWARTTTRNWRQENASKDLCHGACCHDVPLFALLFLSSVTFLNLLKIRRGDSLYPPAKAFTVPFFAPCAVWPVAQSPKNKVARDQHCLRSTCFPETLEANFFLSDESKLMMRIFRLSASLLKYFFRKKTKMRSCNWFLAITYSSFAAPLYGAK